MRRSAQSERFGLLLCCVLLLGFFGASVLSYLTSVRLIRENISTQQLPLTGDTVYSELQKDIIRPIHISADMAHNTFLRDWLLQGEQHPEEMARYLSEIKQKNSTVTAFLVSESSHVYYHADGVLKIVDENEPRDRWYFRVRDLQDDYETNVDPDLANMDKTTVFINYRVKDYDGNFIGAAGVGLTLDNVRTTLNDYERRFENTVYFVDPNGRITLASQGAAVHNGSIVEAGGISVIADEILRSKAREQRLEYRDDDGSTVQVNARFVPELNWYLVLEKNDRVAVSPFRKILTLNLLVSAVAMCVILAIVIPAFKRQQRSLKDVAFNDTLTGLLNRQGLQEHADDLLSGQSRSTEPTALAYFDIDNFKTINDTYGHAAGDAVLSKVATLTSSVVRPSDKVARWGGEEFVVLLPLCDLAEATEIANRIREMIAAHVFQIFDHAVTVSLGVAERSDHETFDELLFRADTALYAAKTSGKNRVVQASYRDGVLVDQGMTASTMAGGSVT